MTSHRRPNVYEEIIDFRPAACPVGWAMYLPDDPREPLIKEPIVGWLIMAPADLDTGHIDWTGPRTARAAILEEATPWPADDSGDNFWRILQPGEPEPSESDIVHAVASYRRRRDQGMAG